MSTSDSMPFAVGRPSTSEAQGDQQGRPDRAWSAARVESEARGHGRDPEQRLLAVFDVLDGVINRADREARAYVAVLANDSAGSVPHAELGTLIETLASEAGLEARGELLLSFELLVVGATHGALGGDLDSAGRARRMAVDLVPHHRPRQPAIVDAFFSHEYDFDLELPSGGAIEHTTVSASKTSRSDAGSSRSVGHTIDPRDNHQAIAEFERVARALDEDWE